MPPYKRSFRIGKPINHRYFCRNAIYDFINPRKKKTGRSRWLLWKRDETHARSLRKKIHISKQR